MSEMRERARISAEPGAQTTSSTSAVNAGATLCAPEVSSIANASTPTRDGVEGASPASAAGAASTTAGGRNQTSNSERNSSTATGDEESETQIFDISNAANNNNQSATTRIWSVLPSPLCPATTTTAAGHTGRGGRGGGVMFGSQMFCCYAFFLFLGFTCVTMGLGIMIQRLNSEEIGDILGYCILIIFGICLQLYAVFDISKYVDAERSYNERRAGNGGIGPEVVIFQRDTPLITTAENGREAQTGAPEVVEIVPTDLPPAYQSTTSRQISSDVTVVHPVTSLPLSTPPSYRTIIVGTQQ